MRKLINKVDWILFAILMFAAFTPLIYKMYRLFLVSHMESDTLSLAINWGYVYMIFESVNIFVIVPSYWFIKKDAKTPEDSNRNMIIILLFTVLAFFISIIMVALIGYPIALSSASTASIDISFSYIYGYIVSYGATLSIHLFINIFIVYIIVHNRKCQAFLLTTLTMMIVMLFDTLFLSMAINPEATLMSISASMMCSSITMLLIIMVNVYFVDYRSWNNSFKLVNKKNLFIGWKLYAKNGMWLGLEAFTWNIFNAMGVFCWFLVSDDGVETAFWVMDGMFWGFLLLPATAVTMFTAEGISNENDAEGRKDVVKVSIMLSCLAILSWTILVPLLVLLAIPNVLDETAEVINMAQTMCWVFVLFIAIQVPTKVIYTYFSTTNRSFYLTIGTLLGASLTWGLSAITFIILNLMGIIPDGGMNNEVAQIVIPLIYGLGILFIFVFYMVFYVLTINDTDESLRLVQRWRMRHELVKAKALSDNQ